MSIRDAESFFVRLMTDEELQEKIKAIDTEGRQATLIELVRIGSEAGFSFSADEYETAVKSVIEDVEEDVEDEEWEDNQQKDFEGDQQ